MVAPDVARVTTDWRDAVDGAKLRLVERMVATRASDLVRDPQLHLDLLVTAVCQQSLAMLKCLMHATPPSEELQSFLSICLHVAADIEAVELIEVLFAHGADVNARSETGITPLFLTVYHTSTDTAELLLRLGADVTESASINRFSPIHEMAQRGRRDLLELVQRMGYDTASFGAQNGRERYTPLHVAAWSGHVDVVQFLLATLGDAADINAESRYGETPLEFAARIGFLDVARSLVAAGAAVNVDDDGGSLSALFSAADNTQFASVQFLCEHGADVLCRRFDGLTALCIAAIKGAADIVEYLAEDGGADLNAGTFGLTPLNEAVIGGHTDVVRVLLAHNAYTHDGAGSNASLLCQAILFSRVDIAELLVARGADVNALYSVVIDGEQVQLTPLLAAAGCGNRRLVEYLCDEGADVDGRSNQDETALFFAALWGNLDVVQYLVMTCGANVLATTSYGFASAHVSSLCGHTAALAFLLDSNALGASVSEPMATTESEPTLTAFWRRKQAIDKLLDGTFLR